MAAKDTHSLESPFTLDPYREREGEEEEEEEGSSSSSSSSSDSGSSRSDSDDLEPEWLDDVQRNGELFYLELSEGEEEAALSQAAAQSPAPNHVRFSEQEAEIIPHGGPPREGPRPEPRLKKLAKILRRKRPSRRGGDRQGGHGCPSSSRPASILKSQPGPRPGPTLQPALRDVCVYVNPKRLTGGGAAQGGLLEALIGILHRPVWDRKQDGQGEEPSAANEEERLAVHGLLPGSPALKCGQILIGDVLIAVNDVDVTSENIERVLSCIPGPTQVKLTLETAPVHAEAAGPVPSPGCPAAPPVSTLVRLLWGEETAELQMSLGDIPHVVMYLSLKLDSESSREEEILYQYPVSEASRPLKGLRGIFLTLCDMLGTVTGGQIISSTLLLNKQLVHVGYWKEGDALLVIGLPADRVPLPQLQPVIRGLVRTLKVMYGSLDRAFCEADNVPRLDHFFCLFFQQRLQPEKLWGGGGGGSPAPDLCGPLFLDCVPALRWLSLPPETKVEIDTILSDLESADFGEMSEDYYGMRRLYVTLGSCLFYKGYLIATHLPTEQLMDVSLYCQHYCLLALGGAQRVGQLLVWREVFPQRGSPPDPPAQAAQGYTEPPHARHFLLIVGLRHFLQCVLLEAGGCAARAEGSQGPDCVYVDQVKATLLQLEGLAGSIEERLAAPPTPGLSCADWFLPAGRDRLDSVPGSPVFGRLPGSSKAPSPTGRRGLFGEATLRSRRPSPQRSLSDSGGEGPGDVSALSPLSTPEAGRRQGRRDSLGSGGSEGSGGSTALLKSSKKRLPNPFHLGTLKKSLSERETEEMYNTLKLSSGVENTLFHYVCMETARGIFLAPTHRELAQLSGSIHPQLIRNFHRCCVAIRALLRPGRSTMERAPGESGRQSLSGLGPVKEHGVLFQCQPENWTDQRKPPPTLTYWVIGRMILEPTPQEFYVCFHDSVEEVPVEMAFRLSFGLAL
ncbi:protein inturned isoform X2 [Amia ocellicauda]|uniref:protein inturned isoform X2 n=1 Tax=Amia ocellicauda TaxID=2972642 RepID=UPI0034642311